jgi:hypothetical protein
MKEQKTAAIGVDVQERMACLGVFGKVWVAAVNVKVHLEDYNTPANTLAFPHLFRLLLVGKVDGTRILNLLQLDKQEASHLEMVME